jgi:casein kinase 1
MFIHLLTPGGLSWTRNGVPKNNAQHDRIIREKRDARPEDLCKGLPVEFEEFLRYCRRLKFAECPDYARWKEEFSELAKEEGFSGTEDFIWPPPPITHVSFDWADEHIFGVDIFVDLAQATFDTYRCFASYTSAARDR